MYILLPLNRVMAENEYGVGVPCEIPDPLKITKEPGQVFRFEITNITKSSAIVAWDKPIHDGGSRITDYVVELYNDDTEEWKELSVIKTLSYKVKIQLIQPAKSMLRSSYYIII